MRKNMQGGKTHNRCCRATRAASKSRLPHQFIHTRSIQQTISFDSQKKRCNQDINNRQDYTQSARGRFDQQRFAWKVHGQRRGERRARTRQGHRDSVSACPKQSASGERPFICDQPPGRVSVIAAFLGALSDTYVSRNRRESPGLILDEI